MTYKVPASKASLKQNRFEFEMPGSKKVYSVPLMKYLSPELILQVEELSQVAAARLIFESCLPEAFSRFEDLDQIQDFMTAWGEASGINLGESEASPAS